MEIKVKLNEYKFELMAKRKIILVDAQSAFRKVLRNILTKFGEVDIVAEASTGAEFLEILEDTKADIAFVDIEMREMNGIETTERALKKHPGIVIIGLSMYENQVHIKSMIEAGAKGYLLKLKNNSEIFQRILQSPRGELFFSEGIKYQREDSGQKTILTVDDFESNTFIVSSALQNAGYHVIKAHSGEEALRKCKETKIDLLVTDYKMPGMNGAELTKKVREMPQYKHIPIIVLSSEKDEDKKIKAREAGISGWVQKPYDLKRFLQIIENALK